MSISHCFLMLVLLRLVLWYLWGLATVMLTVLCDCSYHREAWGLPGYSLAFWLKFSSTISTKLSEIHRHAHLFVLKAESCLCLCDLHSDPWAWLHVTSGKMLACCFFTPHPVSFSGRLVCLSRAGLEQCGTQVMCAMPRFNLSFPRFLASWWEV